MRAKTVAVLAIAGLLLAGCTWTGGGWMPGAQGGKATIGFSGYCPNGPQQFSANTNGDASLTFSYVDKSVSPAVNIKGTDTAPDCSGSFYSQSSDPSAPCYDGGTDDCVRTTFEGEYRPAKGDTGSYSIDYIDTGIQGPSKGDMLDIELTGGKNDGYSNEQVLGGGNYKVRDIFSPV